MKNIFLFIGILVVGAPSFADVCSFNPKKEVADLAAKIIKSQDFVYETTTPGDAVVGLKEVEVKKRSVSIEVIKMGDQSYFQVKQGTGRSQKNFDLAYIYILAGPPSASKLLNLGHITRCFDGVYDWSTNPAARQRDAEAYPAVVDWNAINIDCDGACG
jgi:hypothetical protein